MLISEILPQVADLLPDCPAILTDGYSITFRELYERSSRFANALQKRGVQSGDRVALVGQTHQVIIAEHAAVALGAVPFAVNLSLEDPELIAVLEDAEPVVCICDVVGLERLERLSYAGIDTVISCTESDGLRSVEGLIESHTPLTAWHHGNESDTALMIYTGGTTGQPRGVMHTHRSVMHWLMMDANSRLATAAGSKLLLPNFAHGSGQYGIWRSALEGSCLIISPKYPLSPRDVIDFVATHKLKTLGLAGRLLHDMLSLPDLEKHDVSSVQMVIHSGSPISRNTLYQAAAVFPRAVIAESYGSTEAGMFISMNLMPAPKMANITEERLESVGPAAATSFGQIPYEVKIVDDDGAPVGPRVRGEIICRGDCMMKGYWRNPVATKETIRDGWLYTGDIGWMDEDGYIYLSDRKKDMIIVDASNVYSIEVENVLSICDGVEEVAVLSAPRADEGEEVVAVIRPEPDHTVTLESIRAFCRGKMAEYKIPTRLHLVENLPRTAVDKVDKKEIRAWFWGHAGRRVH